MQDFWKFDKKKILFLGILLTGALFRFYNLNWDDNFHLHPDERFLTMVGNAMKVPNTFSDYLDPQTSTFNPSNIGYKFFVYGVFPLTISKIIAMWAKTDNYNDFTIQGRFLSGLFDLLIVFLVYKTIQLLEKKYGFDKKLKYFASFFYAIAALPIQLSHFFAVDTFLNFFMFASFYFALRFSFYKNILSLILSAIFLGLAISSKVSAIAILLLNFFLIFSFSLAPNLNQHPLKILKFAISKLRILQKLGECFAKIIALIFIYAFITYFSIRISDPYLFENKNFLNPTINHVFLENIKSLQSLSRKDAQFPPAVQWINKSPIVFSLWDLALFGVGIPYFLFILTGIYFIVMKFPRAKLILILLWVIGVFIYQSMQFAQTMRYFIILYPFFAIFTSIGFYYLTQRLAKAYKILILMFIVIWPIMFFSIYTKKHSRVEASEWIYKNLENGSIILGEHWDDPLPLLMINTYGKQFTIELLPVFDPDTEEKWMKMNELLQKADYYILSSNRGWGSVSTVPERYPLMSSFYRNLFDEKTQYKKIKEFTSHPSLRYLGIPIDFPDDFADESFTVYDHPKVIIFQKIDQGLAL